MSETLVQALILTRPNGEEIVVSNDEPVRANNTVTIICDGPRCAVHHGTAAPVTVVINDEEVRKNPDAVDDAFARFIKKQPYAYEKEVYEFCSDRCDRDWMNSVYVVPLSPREKALAMRRNADTKAAIIIDDGDTIATAAAYQTTALTQADGEATN
jgi:hypothetical protein